MNRFTALALLAIAGPIVAYAATPPMVDAAKDSCSGIKWNAAFLKEYPKAPAACRDVRENDGVKFATFNGKVSKVGRNFVQVEISDPYDNPISKIAFQIGTGGRITVGQKVEDVKDLRLGDQLTFWVREGVYGVSPTMTDHPMAILKPESMSTN